MSEVTRILAAIEQGDSLASDELLPIIYQELRELASQKLAGEKPGQTLQATALVHEAYIRLTKDSDRQWDSRGHFFAAAAEAMRRILIDKAREKKSIKRGSDRIRKDLADVDVQIAAPSTDLLDLNDALDKLEEQDNVKANLVKLRYFAGLTIPQAAEALGIAPSTADKYWAYAKCWLRLELEGRGTAQGDS